jgi:murein DD-endopeptidase MepM/ murein hydrolase activator NlpD
LAALIAAPLAVLAQDAGVPEVPTTPPAGACTEPGCAGTELDGIAIPAGVVGRVRWADADGAECHRYHKRRMCEGPRRVPVLDGEAHDRASALDLIRTTRVARVAITGRPDDAWIAAAGPAPATSELLWPVDGGRLWRGHGTVRSMVVTKRGGARPTGRRRHHEGIDIGAATGTPILAANAGLVVYSHNGMAGYGNVVIITHGDGTLTLYAHCTATFVVAGQQVARGQVIAIVGETGLAHGAHLHFEYRVNGVSQDPEPLFTGRPPARGASPPDEEAPSATIEGDEGEGSVTVPVIP